jgi:hypothetical protein
MSLRNECCNNLGYLQEQGLSNNQVDSLHHLSNITLKSHINYFCEDKKGVAERELRPANSIFSHRVTYVANEHKKGNSNFNQLINSALSKWPIDMTIIEKSVGTEINNESTIAERKQQIRKNI